MARNAGAGLIGEPPAGQAAPVAREAEPGFDPDRLIGLGIVPVPPGAEGAVSFARRNELAREGGRELVSRKDVAAPKWRPAGRFRKESSGGVMTAQAQTHAVPESGVTGLYLLMSIAGLRLACRLMNRRNVF